MRLPGARDCGDLLMLDQVRSRLRLGMPQPDRYVYEFRTPTGERAVVQEQDLTDDLRRLASLVLDD